ncbi:MAG: hypothetical protein ABL998_08610 [Planctomycetota bacterium]
MSSKPEETPFNESHLESPEYRKRLLRKLNTLIAVLEVACAKVRRSLAGPEPDIERLTRIQNNLKETLSVCLRAKSALERCEEQQSTSQAAAIEKLLPQQAAQGQATTGKVGELTSVDEQRKFERLGPIDLREVRACDLDELCQKLILGL